MKNLFTQNKWTKVLSLATMFCLPAMATQAQVTDANPIESLRCNLLYLPDNGGSALMDGNLTNYHDIFSNAVGMDDALKMSNNGENFGLLRENRRLAIEQRKKITGNDTIHFVMWNMQRRKYRLQITTDKMNQPTRRAVLEDAYTRTTTVVELNGSTQYDFLVTSDPASFAQNRFRILFTQGRKPPRPITINDVLLTRNGNNIMVQWKVDNEEDMNNYEVELSDNSAEYTPVRTVTPYNNTDGLSYSISYPASHSGDYSFRIRGVSNAGQVYYSKSSTIHLDIEKADVRVFPNPVVNRKVNLEFLEQPVGKYSVFLISANGTRMPLQVIQHQMGATMHQLTLPASLQPGIYRLQLIGSNNQTLVKTINVL